MCKECQLNEERGELCDFCKTATYGGTLYEPSFEDYQKEEIRKYFEEE